MDEKDRIETFLTSFKELENKLLSIAKIKDDGHISFTRALNDIYYSRKNPLISEYDCFDFLKTCADLRNILSHENDICAPSESFLKHFLSIKDKICHPLTCYQACSKKIYSCVKEDSLLRVLKTMEYESLTHIPVLDEKGIVEGIFSRQTAFDYLSMNEEISVDKNTRISFFEEFLPLEDHLNEEFLFVSRNTKVDSVFPLLFKKREHEKNLSLLLVTENGKSYEKLLGILTVTDLTKYKMY